MCGRFTIATTIGLYERFDVGDTDIELQPQFNIAPYQDVPVVLQINGKLQIKMMNWGLNLSSIRRSDIHPINVRSEGIMRHPLFREAFVSYRCMVPATGYYEWKKTKRKKIPFLIKTRDNSFIAFAAIYYPGRSSKSETGTFAIITTTPNTLVAEVHDRMPVILTKEAENIWLSQEDENLLSSVLTPYPIENLFMYQVSNEVNNPKNDSENLIQPSHLFFS